LGLTHLGAVRTIGLTGGIGSGKSSVARVLVTCGAVLVDTDAIARSLTVPGGPAIPAIAEAFGTGMVTPTVRWTATACASMCSPTPVQRPGSKPSCTR
jgi:dephospho-CoA kinase